MLVAWSRRRSLVILGNKGEHLATCATYGGFGLLAKPLICWVNPAKFEVANAGLWSLMSGTVVVMAFEAFIRA
jgi:hypothetical protein